MTEENKKKKRIIALIVAVIIVGGVLIRTQYIRHQESVGQVAKTSERLEEVRKFLNDPKEAWEEYRKTIEAQSDNESMYQLTEETQKALDNEDYDLALKKVNEMLKKSNLQKEYKDQLKEIKLTLCVYLGKGADVIAICDELLDKKEYRKVSELYYYRGVFYLADEKYEEAYRDFDTAIEEGGDTTACYYNRGVAALALGWTDQAKSDLEKVTEMDDEPELQTVAKELLKAI